MCIYSKTVYIGVVWEPYAVWVWGHGREEVVLNTLGREPRPMYTLYILYTSYLVGMHVYTHGVIDAEGRKNVASKVIQTAKQSNTAHPRQSLFQGKMSCLEWDLNPRHSAL